MGNRQGWWTDRLEFNGGIEMAKRGRMCVVPECGRRVTPGALVCADHRETALGKELGREVAALSASVTALEKAEWGSEKREAARSFRQEVMRGEYAALFSSKFDEMLAESGKEHDLTEEIGMLRIAMRRVLTEEEEPARMAHGLAKLSGALGRAIVLQENRERMLGDEEETRLADQLNQILIDLEKESHQVRQPWTVDAGNPPGYLIGEMEKVGIEAGTMEAVQWVEGWKVRKTEEKARQGWVEARRWLEVYGGEGREMLGDGGGGWE